MAKKKKKAAAHAPPAKQEASGSRRPPKYPLLVLSIGAILLAGSKESSLTTVLGFIAVIFATINVFGGFYVTHRMLAMFRKKK